MTITRRGLDKRDLLSPRGCIGALAGRSDERAIQRHIGTEGADDGRPRSYLDVVQGDAWNGDLRAVQVVLCGDGTDRGAL
jgi:hypothetical protein